MLPFMLYEMVLTLASRILERVKGQFLPVVLIIHAVCLFTKDLLEVKRLIIQIGV